jgi:hypothetical protein
MAPYRGWTHRPDAILGRRSTRLSGARDQILGASSAAAAPPFGADHGGHLLEGLRREGRPHLVVVGLVPTDAWNGSVVIRPDTQEWPPLWALVAVLPGAVPRNPPVPARDDRPAFGIAGHAEAEGRAERGQGMMRAVGALGGVADTNNSAKRA